jgi:hypothetical protein
MFRILAIAGALLGLASAAQADVWRWKDPNGTVHYSDSWVPGSVLVKTDSRSSYSTGPAADSSSNASPPTTSSPSAADTAETERVRREVANDVSKAKEEQCKKAREAYDQAIQSRRIYKKGANGEREYLSDADADAYRLNLLNARKEACGS